MKRPPLPVLVIIAFFAVLIGTEAVFVWTAFSLEDDSIVSEPVVP